MSTIVEQLDRQPGLRLKFVRKDRGGQIPYSSEAYWAQVLASQSPPDWEKRELGYVRTQADTRLAWELSQGRTTVAIVSHETGIEILVAIGVGVASGVGSAAIVALANWLYQKNKEQVADTPNQNHISLFAEVYENGNYRTIDLDVKAEPEVIANIHSIVGDFISN